MPCPKRPNSHLALAKSGGLTECFAQSRGEIGANLPTNDSSLPADGSRTGWYGSDFGCLFDGDSLTIFTRNSATRRSRFVGRFASDNRRAFHAVSFGCLKCKERLLCGA